MRIISLCVLLMLIGCDDLCSSDIIQEVKSPDNRYKAISYIYSCGATTGNSTQVSLMDENGVIVKPGNVFIAAGKNQVRLSWLAKDKLLIAMKEKVRIFKKEEKYEGVYFEYR